MSKRTAPGGPRLLRAWRQSHRTTQLALAKQIGVHVSLVNKYEVGRRTFSFEKLIKLSQITGISIQKLAKREQLEKHRRAVAALAAANTSEGAA